MNCLRSLEFIEKIDSKYKQFGLETILIHPPEWEFEKHKKNIIHAIKKYKIKFPVIIDKNKKVIKKLKINFWPTQILIRDGKILYKHIGEGKYKILEGRIIKYLKINPKKFKKLFNKEPKYNKFPTVYCGKEKNGKIQKLSNKLKLGVIYVKGKFVQNNEFLKPIEDDSSLTILTKGKIINFVAKSFKKSIKAKIKLNNKFIKIILVHNPQLYELIKLKKNKQQKLTIFMKKNLAIYSFSFR